MEDFKTGMPLEVAKQYVRVYLEEQPVSYDVASRVFMAELPTYHRTAADAVLAVAVSLAVAEKNGFYLATSRKTVNDLFPGYGALWTTRWPDEKALGPDYLMANQYSGIAFYEVKGRYTRCKYPPDKFYEQKVQSINALFMAPAHRHILSIVHFPADSIRPENVEVQWFNSSVASSDVVQPVPTAAHKLQMLLIAICQFGAQLKISGNDFRKFLKSPVGEWQFDSKAKMWVEAKNSGEKMAVEPTSRFLFSDILNHLEELEPSNFQFMEKWDACVSKRDELFDILIGRLNLVRAGRDRILDKSLERSGYETLYRYNNGIRIIKSVDGESK